MNLRHAHSSNANKSMLTINQYLCIEFNISYRLKCDVLVDIGFDLPFCNKQNRRQKMNNEIKIDNKEEIEGKESIPNRITRKGRKRETA